MDSCAYGSAANSRSCLQFPCACVPVLTMETRPIDVYAMGESRHLYRLASSTEPEPGWETLCHLGRQVSSIAVCGGILYGVLPDGTVAKRPLLSVEPSARQLLFWRDDFDWQLCAPGKVRNLAANGRLLATNEHDDLIELHVSGQAWMLASCYKATCVAIHAGYVYVVGQPDTRGSTHIWRHRLSNITHDSHWQRLCVSPANVLSGMVVLDNGTAILALKNDGVLWKGCGTSGRWTWSIYYDLYRFI